MKTLTKIDTIKRIAKSGLEKAVVLGMCSALGLLFTYNFVSSEEEVIPNCVVTDSTSSRWSDMMTVGGDIKPIQTTRRSFYFRTPSGDTGRVFGEYLPTGSKVTIASERKVFLGPGNFGCSGWPKLKYPPEYHTLKYEEIPEDFFQLP